MLRVLIAEDNLVFAKDLAKAIQDYNCEVVGIARSVEEATRLFEEKEPNLALIDLELDGNGDGADFADYINRTCPIPFLFLTGNIGAGNRFFKKAMATRPAGYIPKGSFIPSQLWHFIEVAMYDYSKAGGLLLNDDAPSLFIRNQFFVKSRGAWEKVNTDDILFLSVQKPYCIIHTLQNQKYLVRKPLDYILSRFSTAPMIRVHQSHAVHLNHIKKYDPVSHRMLLSDETELEVGRSYIKKLPQQLPFLN